MNRGFRAALLAAVACIAWGAASQAADTYRMMTGPQGGSWVPLGGALKDMWEKALPGVSVQSLPGAGIANVRAIEEGKAEIGFGNSISTVDAIEGRAPFDKKHTNVCQVATLYPQYFHVVVPADSPIKTIKDLKGKPITTQPRGNTGELITKQILEVNGLTYNDLKVSFVSYTDSVAQMKDGHAVAFTLGTTAPAGAIMDLAASRDVRVLDLSADLAGMKKLNPGYTLVNIKAGTYPKQAADVKVIGYATHIVASCKMPADKVYGMVKAMSANVPGMVAIVKSIDGLTPKLMAEDIGVPLHAGAKKFYSEVGAIK
ncbi:MAG: TAXI family TRAP transporter solute-binding subunit [Alphaproteobacteria bacterium]|nr:TAXI family TRAP transporter solute-binding subunit [Alphaproteobacteria bacterium]